MLLDCLTIDTWSVSLIKDLERWIRNFIWSSDINQTKLAGTKFLPIWAKVALESGLYLKSMKLQIWGTLQICFYSLVSQSFLIRDRESIHLFKFCFGLNYSVFLRWTRGIEVVEDKWELNYVIFGCGSARMMIGCG